jgi:hypothetical protein
LLGPEEEGVADDRREVAREGGEADVHAGDLEARGVERGLRPLGVQVAVAGELDAVVADFGDLGHRRREVALHVLADRPELQGDRCLLPLFFAAAFI